MARSETRRERKRERKLRSQLLAYAATRIVCEKCGLEQPFAVCDFDPDQPDLLTPCAGPLGIPCNSETAVSLLTFVE